MSPRNHSNFPGALWRMDNSVRGVPFLFFTPPSFPPSHLFPLPLLSRPVGWMLTSYRIFLGLIRPSFFFFPLFLCCKVWIAIQRRAAPDNYCCDRTPLSACFACAPAELFENFISVRRQGCFALAWRAMCSKGTVSARDSFVYISEAVLSNHGAAPETTRPENMQCLTVSKIKLSHPLCVRIVSNCVAVSGNAAWHNWNSW